jgi:2-polyprenyl-3-methyl-5-hydroxy-6-metoxy-1,4-benzoquinol methylase
MQTIEDMIAKYGPWTASNLEYQPGKFTMGHNRGADWPLNRSRNFGMLAEYSLNKPISTQRVLDLGCLEGGLSFHLAKFGAEVVGLEAREINVKKCQFVAEMSGLTKLKFIQGDMLDLEPHNLGQFDLIIASGVLYHVDAPELLPFLRSLKAHCRGVVVFDTHVANQVLEYYELEGGQRIYGRSILEHFEAETAEAKDKKPWASFRNNYSFWPTERSLMNLFKEAGFGFAYRPMMPFIEWKWQDRGIWVADARAPKGACSIAAQAYLDPDPRPQSHSQFDKPHHMKPGNPATKALY